MKPVFIMMISLLAAVSVGATGQGGASPMQDAGQALVVITPDWNSSTGTLQRYERTSEGWRRAGDSFPVVIGRSGMGWGLGLNSERSDGLVKDPPVKKEGDGRSPAGIFPIGAAFGYDESKPEWLKLAYVPLTPATECVDDVKSEYYNAVVDRLALDKAGWDSSEKMREIEVYRWGVIVNQNAERQRGAGSCIFLHLWKGPQSSTAGCTAMEAAHLEEVMRWLDPAAKPVLITLPATEYERLRPEWNLP